jgi:hypothetical protein
MANRRRHEPRWHARGRNAGQTNRQIAQPPFITPKTVEAHLARAFRKLHIDSRAQLPAALSRDQAGTSPGPGGTTQHGWPADRRSLPAEREISTIGDQPSHALPSGSASPSGAQIHMFGTSSPACLPINTSVHNGSARSLGRLHHSA